MKYKTLILLSLIVIFVVFVRFALYLQEINKTPSTSQVQKNLVTQTSEGTVTVTITPKILNHGSVVVFNVELNTHSVELNYDITKIARLSDDARNIYQPISWTGGKGGHHIRGVLTFPTLNKSAKKVTLTISKIDNQDRIFIWNL